jgi:endonuclease YncB( thermonuclease family)
VWVRWLLCLAVLAASGPAWGLEGAAHAVDGGTLEIGGVTLRLAGVDAPELGHRCAVPEGQWSCGVLARDALADLVRGQQVACAEAGTGLWAAAPVRCSVRGRDVGALLVQFGWASALPGADDTYLALEKKARDSRAGIWRGNLDAPWGYLPAPR